MDITEKMIDDHIDWFIGQYGKMIYRYRKINKFTLDEIDNQYIYCSKLCNLDDVFEGRSLSNYLTNIDRSNNRVCCFADNYNNEALWALYANRCNGICVAIDLNDIKKCPYEVKKHFITLEKCIYANKQKLSCNITINESPLYKNDSWNWQNESRLIIDDDSFDGKINLPIKAVYIGISVKKKVVSRIQNICQENNILCYKQVDMIVGFSYLPIEKIHLINLLKKE